MLAREYKLVIVYVYDKCICIFRNVMWKSLCQRKEDSNEIDTMYISRNSFPGRHINGIGYNRLKSSYFKIAFEVSIVCVYRDIYAEYAFR